MSSTAKTLSAAVTPGITFDVPDNTVVAPAQNLRIKVTYVQAAGGATVDNNSVFQPPVITNMIVTNPNAPYDTYTRASDGSSMSAYLTVTIDHDITTGINPSVTVTFDTVSATLPLTGKSRDEFSENGFAPITYGSFIKDLSPAPDGALPDLNHNSHIKVRVTAVDKNGNPIPHFQIPLFADTHSILVRIFPVDAYTIENEILTNPGKGQNSFAINTDDNGSRELYVFVRKPAQNNITGGTLDLKVNIPGLAVENGSNQVLIIAADVTTSKVDAPSIPDMDGNSLDPGDSDEPDFGVVIPKYNSSGKGEGDTIYVMARSSSGKEDYLGHKRMPRDYKWGESVLFYVPYSGFTSTGIYYVYYYVADAVGNVTQSADLYINLVAQVPNLPTDGPKKFKQPVEVWTTYGLEIVSPPGRVNEYSVIGGLDIRVPVDLTNPAYVHKGDSVVVTMRTDGWSPDGSKKSITQDFEPPAAVSDGDIAQGYITAHVDQTYLFGYESDAHGRPGSITFEYSVGDDYSVGWYGSIDTTPPGESN